jgi:hypothetical protein
VEGEDDLDPKDPTRRLRRRMKSPEDRNQNRNSILEEVEAEEVPTISVMDLEGDHLGLAELYAPSEIEEHDENDDMFSDSDDDEFMMRELPYWFVQEIMEIDSSSPTDTHSDE